jgi:uncharacterized membrane protein (UPF0127 family)
MGWKKCASLLLVLSGSALAGEPCPAEQATAVAIGAQRFPVEVAATPDARERGLSGRPGLAAASGMWFVLANIGQPGFWMRGMNFPIDLIWVSPELRVVGATTLPPCRNDPCPISYPEAPVAYVLEIDAGHFRGRRDDQVTWDCSP